MERGKEKTGQESHARSNKTNESNQKYKNAQNTKAMGWKIRIKLKREKGTGEITEKTHRTKQKERRKRTGNRSEKATHEEKDEKRKEKT